jgi:galactokinase
LGNLVDTTIHAFQQALGREPDLVASAPGRVNLIGEHTDYNEGFVLPAAIDRRIYVAAGRRDGAEISIYAADYGARVQTNLENLSQRELPLWANYSKGVLHEIARSGEKIGGLDLCITGNVPQNAGLSSSAALEVATAVAVKEIFDLDIEGIALAKLCQKAENEFVGVHCGIMDQFAAVYGKKGHALLLDCRSLNFEPIAFPAGVSVVVCDTGIRRELANSEYNKRRQECRIGVKELSLVLPKIRGLRDVKLSAFLEHENLLNQTIRKRCRHVIDENRRVLEAAADLKRNDMSDFGKLMYQSHLSLKNNYEVSCEELDAVVDIAASTDGVIGARMTGAGFGGSVVCMVETGSLKLLESNLFERYHKLMSGQLAVYVCEIDDGARVDWKKGAELIQRPKPA